MVEELTWHVDGCERHKGVGAVGGEGFRNVLTKERKRASDRPTGDTAVAEIGAACRLGGSVSDFADVPACACLSGKVIPHNGEDLVGLTQHEVF